MEQIPEEQRERYAIALLRRSLTQDAPTQEELAGYASRADFEDGCAGIAEGIADAEAGRTLSWEEAQEEWAAARTAWRQSRLASEADDAESLPSFVIRVTRRATADIQFVTIAGAAS